MEKEWESVTGKNNIPELRERKGVTLYSTVKENYFPISLRLKVPAV